MERIKPFINKPVVKVITGLRRVGKSYFMRLIIKYLQQQDINDQQIIYLDMESIDFDFIRTYQQLHDYIKNQPNLAPGEKIYLFIDEVQKIDGWEKCIASYLGDGNYDIYLTGSNASMLSSELASLYPAATSSFPFIPWVSVNSWTLWAKKRRTASANSPSICNSEAFQHCPTLTSTKKLFINTSAPSMIPSC
jgi:predicted AAA+ superfamily ATPase